MVSASKRKRGKGKGGKGGKKGDGKGGKDEDSVAGSGPEEEGAPHPKRQKKDSKHGGRGDIWREQPGELVMENKQWEAYYKRQGVCADEDWPRLMETLKTGLPVAIRVNRMRAGAAALCTRLEDMHATCGNDAERECYAPQLLGWYPRGAAWQWRSLERRSIKKDRRHLRLKEYLTHRERRGLITRQEVVSMLPPLFLDVEAHHTVLDMCAAPGSKTSQMVEMMHWAHAVDGAAPPTGLVMANDVQWKRANMLAHQVARLGSPCAVVVNMDAQFFPDLWTPPAEPGGASEQFRFDRVLCDVPCSGDGTMRKTPYIWKSWTWRDGLALHIRQFNILCRGLELLKVGGRLVYSTCSLNPIEDEAVVAAALRRHGACIALVPPPASLSAVQAAEGLNRWVVPHPHKETEEYFESYDEVPAEMRSGKMHLKASMFPPVPGDDPEEARIRDSLRHCRRMLPHLMDTGGFFVTVFEKLSDLRPSAKARREAFREEKLAARAQQQASPDAAAAGAEPSAAASDAAAAPPLQAAPPLDAKPASQGPQAPQGLKNIQKEYGFVEAEDWEEIREFYGLDAALSSRFAFRSAGDHRQQLFLLSEGASRLIRLQVRLPTRAVLCGVLALKRAGSHHIDACPWELAQEGIASFAALGPERKIEMQPALLRRLLQERDLGLDELREAESRGEARGAAKAIGGQDGKPLRPGSIVVMLLRDDEGASSRLPAVAVAAMVSDGALESSVSNAEEVAALLEDIGDQPTVDEILGSAEVVAGEEEKAEVCDEAADSAEEADEPEDAVATEAAGATSSAP